MHEENVYKWTPLKKYSVENTTLHLKTKNARNNSFPCDCFSCVSVTCDPLVILNECFGRIISLIFINRNFFFELSKYYVPNTVFLLSMADDLGDKTIHEKECIDLRNIC